MCAGICARCPYNHTQLKHGGRAGGGGKETRNGAGVTPVNTEKIKKVSLPYTLFQKSQKIKKRFIYEILGTKSIDI
jgi:hypothetical protein